MKNRASLSLRYVMWGQRIWQLSDSEKPWEQWSYQSCTVIPNCVKGDRGDNTQNHWYVPKQTIKEVFLLVLLDVEDILRVRVHSQFY